MYIPGRQEPFDIDMPDLAQSEGSIHRSYETNNTARTMFRRQEPELLLLEDQRTCYQHRCSKQTPLGSTLLTSEYPGPSCDPIGTKWNKRSR